MPLDDTLMVVTDGILLTAPMLEPVHRVSQDAVFHLGALLVAAICSEISKEKYREIGYVMSHLSRHVWPRLKCGLTKTPTLVERRSVVCLLVRLCLADGNIYKDDVLEQE